MKVLICSDGRPPAERAVRFLTRTAAACQWQVTLLGIIEHPSDEAALTAALRGCADLLRAREVAVETVTRSGQPLREIQRRIRDERYDLVVIGAERKRNGPFALSAKAYHLIKEVEPPVLVLIGDRPDLKKALLCSGGQRYTDRVVDLAVGMACKTRVEMTLLHVLAEAPPIYSGIIEAGEDAADVLSSDSRLGQNLRAEMETLLARGVPTHIKVRHGFVVSEILKEVEEGNYDLVVTGAAPTKGALRTYMLGDVTAEIVNRAECAVLVVRAEPDPARPNFLTRLKARFRRRSQAQRRLHPS